MYQLVSSHLTFSDLLSIFAGVSSPLERLRRPLQQFVREHLLNDASPTEENLRAAANRLVEDCRPDTLEACVSGKEWIHWKELLVSSNLCDGRGIVNG